MKGLELFRTSTFQLAIVYMGLFGASVLLLLGFLYWSTIGYMSRQTDATIEAEITGLAEQYRRGGLNGLVRVIADRVERNPDGSLLYLFASRDYQPLAGNLTEWPEFVATPEGWLEFSYVDPATGEDSIPARAKLFGLTGGLRLLVGRDLRELKQTEAMILRALAWGLGITVALALIGGSMMSRSMVRRIDAINQTSREIITGDLSQRIPTRGTGDDFDQLAGNLNAMLDQIEKLMGGIKHVADDVAHDLRTPLTRLRTRLEQLRPLPNLSDTARAEVEGCIDEADQILHTFTALLRIARIESGDRSSGFTSVDLAVLARDASELYAAVAEQKNVQFETVLAEVPAIRGDRDLLFQATTNLLDNAIKYTPAGGVVRLAVSHDGSGVELEISDTGPGIPEPERAKALERFYRLESSRSTAGNGLGLSLVDAVASLHRAKLRLEDNNPGLKVTVSFPVTA